MKIPDFLEEHKVEFAVITHPVTFDAQRMAETVKVTGHEVAKTVLLRTDSDYPYIVAVLPADTMIDFERTSSLLGGCEVELASEPDIAEQCPDCEIGALPPFGSQYGMKTIVDESLTGQHQITFEGNTHDKAIRMKFRDFRKIEQPLIGKIVWES